MGIPDRMNAYPVLDKEDWSYNYSAVTFDNDGRVKEWNNSGNLKVQLPISATASSFTMGSTKETVLAAMGTPTAIRKYPALDKEDWTYSYSAVTFSNAGVVKEWNNDGSLKVVLLPSSNAGKPGSFTVGSTKDEVLAVMGTPTAVRKYPALDKEDWSYGYSGVTFTNSGRVKEWHNSGNLKVQLPISATAPSFTMGSPKETVLAAMGTPTAIRKYPALDKEDWTYNYSTVTFSNEGVVKEWNNDGTLKVVLLPSPNAGKPGSFTVGSTKDEVLAVMGTPTAIRKYPALDKEEWSYGYSHVTFNTGGRVREWSNDGNLKLR